MEELEESQERGITRDLRKSSFCAMALSRLGRVAVPEWPLAWTTYLRGLSSTYDRSKLGSYVCMSLAYFT
jgi:hypothetical protein